MDHPLGWVNLGLVLRKIASQDFDGLIKGAYHRPTPDFWEVLLNEGGDCFHPVDHIQVGHVVVLLGGAWHIGGFTL